MTKRVRSSMSGLIIGAITLALGILIIQHSNAFLKIIMVTAGAAALLDGIYTLIGIRRWQYTNLTKKLTLIKGLESTIVGLVAVLMGIFAADTAFTVMVYIFAISLVFSAIVSVQNAIVAGNFGIIDMRGHFIGEAVIEILIAIILFFKPVETLELIVKVLAIAFIVVGSLAIVFAFIVLFSKPKKVADVGEAEVVDDKK